MRGVYLFVAFAAACGAAGEVALPGLVEEAMKNNPEVLAARKRYEAAERREGPAGALPDPTFSVGYTSNGNPLPGAGLGTYATSNIGVSVTQGIPYPGKRRLREEAARKGAEAEYEQYRQTMLDVVARVKQAFFQLHHTYAEGEVLGRNRELLRELLKVAEARYAAGKAAQQDLFKLQTELTIIETKAMELGQEREVAEAELVRLLNRKPGSRIERPVEPEVGPMAASREALEAAAEEAPGVARDSKLVERGETDVALARKDFHPDYAVTAGYYNQGSMAPMYSVRLDVGLPVFRSRKLRPALEASVDELAAARREWEGARANARARVRQDYAIARTSFDLMRVYEDTAIPQAKLAIESALPEYETGSLDLLTVLTNYTTVIDLEMNYHEEMLNYHLALTRLEEETGVALVK